MSDKIEKLNFEILVDESLLSIDSKNELKPNNNKHLLCLINDFEDGKWRKTKFNSFIWDNIAETALSAKERKCLINQHHSALVAAAKNLRLTDKEKNDIGKGSELAEIALYGVMKLHYQALPIVPKIFYKQNQQDYAKGSDSVHIVLEENNDFSIWFGEAKFYNSIEDSRLDTIIDSIKNSLSTEKLKKENSIITNLSDIHYLGLEEKIQNEIIYSLSPKESIDSLKPKIHIPILILHECHLTKECSELSDEYKNAISNFHKERAMAFFTKQIKQIGSIFKYAEITFHLILFPVPEKEPIISEFLSNVEHYKLQ